LAASRRGTPTSINPWPVIFWLVIVIKPRRMI
jgi:hypothetical protein